MSGPNLEEMQAKRDEMIASLKDVAAAMSRCVAVIDEYTRHSPSTYAADDSRKERKKRKKEPKDPNAPKRPPSAYILYQNEVREQIRLNNPNLPYKEILAMIAQGWKELPEEKKKIYEAAYNNANNNYRAEEEQYKASLGLASAAIAAVEVDESESDSDAESSSEESVPHVVPTSHALQMAKPSSAKKVQKVIPHATPIVPPTLAAVSTPSDPKKEKRKKLREEEAAVAASLGMGEKKRKKKSKD